MATTKRRKAKRAAASVNVPEFLTEDEFRKGLSELSGDYALLAKLAFGTGLRLMELLRLRVKDLDFGNGLVMVRRGKGDKDRVVLDRPRVLFGPDTGGLLSSVREDVLADELIRCRRDAPTIQTATKCRLRQWFRFDII